MITTLKEILILLACLYLFLVLRSHYSKGESIPSFRHVPRPYRRHFRIRLYSSVLIFGKSKRVLISMRIKPSLPIGKGWPVNKGSMSG